MLEGGNPFMRHEFLNGLEISGCVSEAHGWQPAHIAVYADTKQQRLLGAMPCYQKNHSYGEYIFDWSWADAYFRHGLDYYPKLSNAVPFTPATGPRWLVDTEADANLIISALLQRALELVEERSLSSFHSLFLTEQQAELCCAQGMSMRHSSQFHWHNRDYPDFDHFLAELSAKKRKNIKRERRRVKESDVHYRWLSGAQLQGDAVAQMHQFYLRTIRYYGAQAYLNRDFFNHLADHLADQTLFLFAYYEDQVIAGGLYFKSDNTLYGRYWGALNNFHSVHFETCYYQAIQWCIEHSYQRFEAGAQGEHKLARGLTPSPTYSAHYMSHPQFQQAIDQFLQQEQHHMEGYQRAMQARSPFKQEL